jgi:membrane fusion protein, multidrug efflux system
MALALLLIAGAIAFYIHYDRHLRYFQDTNDARIEADQVTISSKLAGYVKQVLVEDNQAIGMGTQLVSIDPLDFETRLAEAEAGIATAEAARDAARAAKAEGTAGVDQARAGLRAAQASLSFAEREVSRYRPLVAEGAESQMRLSQLLADRDRAAAEVAAQRAGLVQAQKRVGSLAAQTRNLAAQVAAARVQRQAAANDLSSTTITSPIDGRVANRSVRVGQYVQPGQRLMTIVPVKDVYVVANFKETQVGLMRPGQPARIVVDALPGVVFHGVVTSVSPGTGANFSLIKPENATGNFTKIVQRVPVRIRMNAGPAARQVLVPGLSLVVEVDTRASREELEKIRSEQAQSGK